jgi:hypothetical protein
LERTQGDKTRVTNKAGEEGKQVKMRRLSGDFSNLSGGEQCKKIAVKCFHKTFLKTTMLIFLPVSIV